MVQRQGSGYGGENSELGSGQPEGGLAAGLLGSLQAIFEGVKIASDAVTNPQAFAQDVVGGLTTPTVAPSLAGVATALPGALAAAAGLDPRFAIPQWAPRAAAPILRTVAAVRAVAGGRVPAGHPLRRPALPVRRAPPRPAVRSAARTNPLARPPVRWR